ncbi:hypothetical protein [Pontiella sulfatireligans]|uniref:Uncharacterized protein n=1 Tax=Pontiella sulfatireligans TaxID=2750658 RepID=A0A6C2UMP3_9BACT|nr:hypothetical protein [Pontiella sulfatireligans]VGO21408.1 hypothetical protein SCARR_03481 [Pontiella sulfatireligans]
MKKQFIIATALAAGFAAQAANIHIATDITVSTVWTSNNVYTLDTVIFVDNGATLTIEPGTVIRGFEPGGTSARPGALVIARGSKIRAKGTAEAPIVMTDESDDNVGGATGTGPYFQQNNGMAEHWGGLIVLGNSYIATDVGDPGTPSPDGSLELQIEGIEDFGDVSKYGGGDDDDDSGEISYVSIRYGGYVIGSDNEINGLTLGAVGRETKIDHVEVFQNKDDGVEFFGSTVDTKYMLVWSVGDDGFDWDQGFRGKGQFWMNVQGPLAETDDKSDKGSEMDGGDGDSSQPSSCPTIYNATYIGLANTADTKNTALHFRDGTAGRYYNSVFMDFGGAPMLIEKDPSSTDGSGYKTTLDYVNDAYYTHSTGGKMLELKGNVFFNIGTGTDIPDNAAEGQTYGASSGDSSKEHYGTADGFNPFASNNTYAASSPIASLFRSPIATTIGGKDYNSVFFLNPSAANDAASVSMNVPVDGFFAKANYAGAFGSYNWAANWTTADRLGYFVGISDTVPAPVLNGFAGYSIEFETVLGVTYYVQEATLPGPWTNVGIVEGTGGYVTFTTEMLDDSKVYQVVVM